MTPRSLLATAVLVLAPAIARADLIAPDPVRDACAGKKAGDACDLDGKSGGCKDSTCTRTVGGALNREEVSEPCVVCDPAAAPPAKVDPPAKTEPPSKPDAKPDAKASTPEASKGCNLGDDALAPTSVLLGLVVLVALRRR